MVDYKRLLDVVTGSLGRVSQSVVGEGRGGLIEKVGKQATDLAARSPDQFLKKAKDLAVKHPELTQAALVGLAGLLFKKRKSGLSSGLVRAGRTRGHRRPCLPRLAEPNRHPPGRSGSRGEREGRASRKSFPLHLPDRGRRASLLRTMIAAACADGQIDEAERARILQGMKEAGIDPDSSNWLDAEFASPADVDELADAVNDRDTASQVYAAARITIDPDTLQERDFLRRLAVALDLDEEILREVDAAVVALRGQPS